MRAIRIMALLVWLISSLLGILIFSNLTSVQWDFGEPRYGKKWVYQSVSVAYNGYMFDVSFILNISLLDASNNTLTSKTEHRILKPGSRVLLEFNFSVENISDIKWVVTSISLYQLIGNSRIIGISIISMRQQGGA